MVETCMTLRWKVENQKSIRIQNLSKALFVPSEWAYKVHFLQQSWKWKMPILETHLPGSCFHFQDPQLHRLRTPKVFPPNLGFCRLALKHGTDMLPIYGFGRLPLFHSQRHVLGCTDTWQLMRSELTTFFVHLNKHDSADMILARSLNENI